LDESEKTAPGVVRLENKNKTAKLFMLPFAYPSA
jgi:hypothetical protein